MSNAMYVPGAVLWMTTGVNWGSATIKAALVKATYTPNLTSHDFYDDVSAHVLGSPVALTGKVTTGGKFDADDVTFPTPTVGQALLGVVLYIDTGVPGTSPLLWWMPSITGFPFTTSGSDVIIQWDNGTNKIFSLV